MTFKIHEFSFFVEDNFLHSGNELLFDYLISYYLHRKYPNLLTVIDEKYVEIELISTNGEKFFINYGKHSGISGKFRLGRGYRLPRLSHSGNNE